MQWADEVFINYAERLLEGITVRTKKDRSLNCLMHKQRPHYFCYVNLFCSDIIHFKVVALFIGDIYFMI